MERTFLIRLVFPFASRRPLVKRRRKFTAGRKRPLRSDHFRTGNARFWPSGAYRGQVPGESKTKP
jgi:hypothetical protein